MPAAGPPRPTARPDPPTPRRWRRKTAIELALLLLVIATALAYVARRIGIAYPILLVLGGLVLGFIAWRIPDAPSVELPPEAVFLLFLPPILFGAGLSHAVRDVKANLRPIGLLAIGLVLFTTLVVGVVAGLLVPSLQWAPAFALGAIVAPPDAVAATSVLRRLGVPRRIVTILEGESLINDASALIAYRVAVAAVLTGSFAALDAGVSFVVVGVGGIAIGVLVGILVTGAWRRTGDPTLEIILSLIAPIAAYLAAETVGVSGVLATVTAGLIAGRRASRVALPGRPPARHRGLVGRLLPHRQLPVHAHRPPIAVRGGGPDGLQHRRARRARGRGQPDRDRRAVRLGLPGDLPAQAAECRIRERDPAPPRGAVVIIGMGRDARRGLARGGAVAAGRAVGLPGARSDHLPDVLRDPRDARRPGADAAVDHRPTGLVAGTGLEREENLARQAAIDAALDRLEGLAVEYADHLPLVDQLKARFAHEADHAWPDGDGDLDEADRERVDHQAIRLAVVEAQREAVIRLRDDGVIGDEALRRVERDLDLEALRSGV